MEDGILITHMALAHPLYPFTSSSRNKYPNLKVADVFPPDDLSSGPETER